MLNERIYTYRELGSKSPKIKQFKLSRRMQFQDAFALIESENIRGYIVIANADIYFDSSLQNIYGLQLEKHKRLLAQLRYDLPTKHSSTHRPLLFGPRPDSQDCWIFHSTHNPLEGDRGVFNFPFGKSGCDNKVAYLFAALGFEVCNDPIVVKSYHIHRTEIRDYNPNDKVPGPYLLIGPNLSGSGKTPKAMVEEQKTVWKSPLGWYLQRYGLDITGVTGKYRHHLFKQDNDSLFKLIQNKLQANDKFLVVRVSHIETRMAFAGYKLSLISRSSIKSTDEIAYLNYVNKSLSVLKTNAGIKLTDFADLLNYSQLYFASFTNADITCTWAPWDKMYQSTYGEHAHIEEILKARDATTVYAEVLSIFHHIRRNPWTWALRGKRLLIISSFIGSIREKIPVRDRLYGVDLFPECNFVFLKPPQTHGANDNRGFQTELDDFQKKVSAITDKFDVALVSCGGYGNIICDHIYKMGKSAIYVGGVLQMYFGIYGIRWLKDSKDIMRLYLNKHWSRPKPDELPLAPETIERDAISRITCLELIRQ